MTTYKRNAPKPSQTPAADKPNMARIHDLTSFAAISIPHELRQILGEEEYERHIKEIESYELVMVTIVTQNVDDLHERAGSADVLHLHGSLHPPRCFACVRAHILPPGIPEEPNGRRRLCPPCCTH